MKHDDIDLNYFNDRNSHYCDFCAVKMNDGFEVLPDGREMCIDCSDSKVETEEEVVKIFEYAKTKMEELFKIKFEETMFQVCIINESELKNLQDEYLKPTSWYDPRSVALAIPNEMKLYIETNAPKKVTLAYIVHELTNIWQYIHWNVSEIASVYEKQNTFIIYEGMAVWAEIQFMYLLNEVSYANRRELYYERCFDGGSDNHYVLGLKEYKKQFPFLKETNAIENTPFLKRLPLKHPLEFALHACDFCAKVMFKGDLTVLRDGREQCDECEETAVKEINKTFIEIYKDIQIKMQTDFGIFIDVPVFICMEYANEIATLLGKRFVPTSNFDSRAIGVAYQNYDGHGYSIYIENYTPEMEAIKTIVHEIAHIWQYRNWKEKSNIIKEYGEEDTKLLYEGMAVWTEIQFLFFLNLKEIAFECIKNKLSREDEYGWGLFNYMKEYPFVDTPEYLKKSPFRTNIFPDNKLQCPLLSPVERPSTTEMLNMFKNYFEKKIK